MVSYLALGVQWLNHVLSIHENQISKARLLQSNISPDEMLFDPRQPSKFSLNP